MKNNREQKYVFHDYELSNSGINELKIRIYNVFAQRGSTMISSDSKHALKNRKNKKNRLGIKTLFFFSHMRDSFHTLTQNWLCIPHYGCLNLMFHIEFDARQVFLLKLGNSGLNTKYINYRFLPFFCRYFHSAEKR